MFFSGFRGGIHPPEHKEKTKEKSIVEVSPEETMVFILAQGGKPCEPCVSVGDRVLKGQKIGDSTEYMSVPVHSSVSGTVESIENVLTPRGEKAEAVIIKNDFCDEEVRTEVLCDIENISKDELIGIMRNAGIVGMGGAGFPSFIKLVTDKEIDTFIVNAAECEPYLTSDYRAMLEHGEELVEGLKILMSALDVKKGIIAIEDNKRDAAKAVKKIIKPSMSVKLLRTKYPQGSEKQLIYAVTGRTIPEGKLPADVGVIVFNVDTVSAICRAVKYGRPLYQRIVTVSGDAVKNPGNYLVRVGTSFRAVFEAAGGLVCQPKKIIMGGPMMGIAQYSVDIPVVKTTSGLLALTEEEIREKSEAPCLRCGKCVKMCPMGLVPVEVSSLVKKGELEKAKKLGIMSCIECGCCAYTCPSDRNPVAVIRQGKRALRARK